MSGNFDRRLPKRAEPKTFFWHFKPVGVVYLLIGVMPLQNLFHSDRRLLKFSILSFSFAYSALLFGANVIGMVNFRDPFLLFHELKSFRGSNIWRYLVILLVTIRFIMSYYFCITRTRKLIKLIQVLDLFDYKKSTSFKGTSWEALRRFFGWTLFPILSTFGVVSLLVCLYTEFAKSTFDESKQPKHTSIFFGLMAAWQMTPILLYNYFAFIIFYNFNDIKRTALRNIPLKLLYKNENVPIPPNFKTTLQNLNQMYFLMADAVKYLSNNFGWFLAIDQLYIIIMFVLNLYIYFFTESSDQNLLVCIVTNTVVNFVVINISHKVSEEAGKVVEFMQKLPPLVLEGEDKVEVQIILQQILSSSVHVSAAGFFSINRQRIPAILSSIATYLIVLVQFTKQSIYNEDYNRTTSSQPVPNN